jgi:RNA polymerase sigma-70 factor (ECF subfamily)
VTDQPPSPPPPDLQALLVRHLPAVEGYLRLRMGPLLRAKESAADLAQSVAAGAMAALAQFEYRGEAAFRQWLFARAQHKLQEHARHFQQARRDALREQPVGDESRLPLLESFRQLATPSRELAIAESIAAIERAFDALPAEWQEAIALHRLGGLSHAQVAAQMGKSEGAVRNLVYRGLSRLGIELDRLLGND